MTQVDLKSPNLTYSPPNYYSFGVPPTQSDPFETNSVEVCGARKVQIWLTLLTFYLIMYLLWAEASCSFTTPHPSKVS